MATRRKCPRASAATGICRGAREWGRNERGGVRTGAHAGKRLLAIRTRDELNAKLNAEAGVIATFDHLLALMDQPEPAPTPAVPSTPSGA